MADDREFRTRPPQAGLRSEEKGEWRATMWWIAGAIVLALFIRSFIFEPFRIPSGSMRPTLEIGDFIFVSKYTYGYGRYSFPLGAINFSGRIFVERAPERGDVTVFRNPVNPERTFVKRIIGLPGDKIEMRDGYLFINDAGIKRISIGAYRFTDIPGQPVVPEYREELPNGRHIKILEVQGNNGRWDTAGPYLVPAHHYFMMGDNRDSSQDSRFLSEVGFVPHSHLIGPARLVWLSFKADGPFYDFFRFERFFLKINEDLIRKDDGQTGNVSQKNLALAKK